METPVTLDEWRARVTDLEEQIKAHEAEYAGKRFDEDAKERYNILNSERDEAEKAVQELALRAERIASFGQRVEAVEEPHFYTAPKSATRGEDIWEFSTINRSYDNPEVEERELHERGLRAIEMARFPHPDAARHSEDVQGHLEGLLEDGESRSGADMARYFLATGSPEYKRAFTKYVTGAPRSDREERLLHRAMSLTLASGGAAVPYILDPSVIPVSNGAVNPYRQISNVETVTVDEWRGVTSAGITAAYQAEAAATTDQSPTLAQPAVSTEMGRVNIPYSIEIGMDWGGFAGAMAQDIQDSRDVLDASKFAVGTGTNEPFGVVTGATTVYTSSSTNVLFTVDIYGVHNALPPRFRNGASWSLNNNVLDKIRQLDTAGGSAMLQANIQLRSAAQVASFEDGRAGVDIFGHPVYEASGQSGTMTTGQLIGVVGDFRYYKIIDRVGLAIVDAGFAQDSGTGMPTGQKFLFAYWRTGAKVLSANAFRTLKLA